ncbi:hypothetical protein [Herbaspirillum huttiense]|uniref:hypothetical protein n=1 Tax=Herbaspirillum huttiense TaxID=863372 RepID=UPI000584A405|nr:hypothetical protein [Herbaspirillum huttiense]
MSIKKSPRLKVVTAMLVLTSLSGDLTPFQRLTIMNSAQSRQATPAVSTFCTGHPSTYKRIRAGFEGAGQVVLGRNAAESTAVMANAPGPLELLPTAQYKTWSNRGERHWLRVSYVGIGQRGMAEEMESFLGEGDPYRNIYLNNSSDWWKLIREDLIDPAGREDSKHDH